MKKELLENLRRERGKQELNIGDEVVVHSASNELMYNGNVATIIEKGIIGNEVYYGLYIKGKIVEKRSKSLMGAAGIIGATSLLVPFYAEDLELVKKSTDKQPTVGSITIPVKVNFDETYWSAYRTELARMLVLKLIGPNEIYNLKNANHITDFVARIVENLRKE